MPVYYSPQDPARYQQQQQSLRSQQVQNMLRMMMQMQALKQDKSQWEQGQALKQQQMALSGEQFKSLDQYRKAQEKYQDYLMSKPSKTPDWVIQAQALVSTGKAKDMGTAVMMLKNIKKEKTLKEKELEAETLATARARGGGTGRFALPKTTKTPEKTLTPTSKLTNRRLIESNLIDRWGEILEDPDFARTDEKRINRLEYYRASDDIHLDMPQKYTLYKRYANEGLLKPEEEQYLKKADLTRAFLANHPEIYSIEDISPYAKQRLDPVTIRTILEYRGKPKKDGLIEKYIKKIF